MTLELVEGMTNQPGVCALCNGNPPGDDGQSQQCIHAIGVDIDWGNDLYICWECANIISDLIGRVDSGEHEAVLKTNEKLEKDLIKLERKHGRLRTRAQAVVKGERAKKELTRGRG